MILPVSLEYYLEYLRKLRINFRFKGTERALLDDTDPGDIKIFYHPIASFEYILWIVDKKTLKRFERLPVQTKIDFIRNRIAEQLIVEGEVNKEFLNNFLAKDVEGFENIIFRWLGRNLFVVRGKKIYINLGLDGAVSLFHEVCHIIFPEEDDEIEIERRARDISKKMKSSDLKKLSIMILYKIISAR